MYSGPGWGTIILISLVKKLRSREVKECGFSDRQSGAETNPTCALLFAHAPFTDTETKSCNGFIQSHTLSWADTGSGLRLSDALHRTPYCLPTRRGSLWRLWLPECDKDKQSLGLCSDHSATGAQRARRESEEGRAHQTWAQTGHGEPLMSSSRADMEKPSLIQHTVTLPVLNPKGPTEIPRAPLPQRPGVA